MNHDPARSAEYPTHPRVWAEIDLVALAHNLREIRDRSGGARILLVVKANAYGHGMRLVAKHALRVGVAGLCVATPEEAAELRRAVGSGPRIVVLGPWLPEEAETLLRNDAELCLHQEGDHRYLDDLAARMGVCAKVHLNVDTGLGRLGISPEAAVSEGVALRSSQYLRWVGTMTHLASARDPEDLIAHAQLARFEAFCRSVPDSNRPEGVPMCHVAASTAVFSGLESRCDTIRPGIAAYGSLPVGLPGREHLIPVLSLRARITALRVIECGHTVGYGATWRAARRTRLATLPLGYADGLPWRVAGREGFVLVRGQRAPIVGRVSMDTTTIDVTDLPEVQAGDVVTLIGRDGPERIRCEELAQKSGTIPYEVFCSLGSRVTRLAVREEEALEGLELPRRAPGTPLSTSPLSPSPRPSEKPSGRAILPKMAQSLPSATQGEDRDSGPWDSRVDQER